MVFLSREEAGRELGEHLRKLGIAADIVLGLPRGGVMVAAEVARILGRPLDVLVVRKIGHPHQREFAVGAMAEPDVLVLDPAVMAETRADDKDLREVIAEEERRMQKNRTQFHPSGMPRLAGRTVLLVDDGLATGATMEAAIVSVRKQNVQRVIVACPVASAHAARRLKLLADEVTALVVDEEFAAVGQYYRQFSQTTDEKVLTLIHAHA
jgi:predicted phosphoribosyltransferase